MEDFYFLLLVYLYFLCYFYNKSKPTKTLFIFFKNEMQVPKQPLLVRQQAFPFNSGLQGGLSALTPLCVIARRRVPEVSPSNTCNL